MKTIPLTQGKEVIVDDADYDELSKHRWCYTNGYAVRRKSTKKGDPDTDPEGSQHEYLHWRLAGAKRGDVVLSLDGNKLNCCRDNLAVADRKLRQQRMAPRGVSGFKGVSIRGNRWQAHIGVRGKTIHLGRFVDKVDAAREYDKAAVKYYGSHAQLNFPESTVEVQPMTQEAEVAHG